MHICTYVISCDDISIFDFLILAILFLFFSFFFLSLSSLSFDYILLSETHRKGADEKKSFNSTTNFFDNPSIKPFRNGTGNSIPFYMTLTSLRRELVSNHVKGSNHTVDPFYFNRRLTYVRE